eukprot:TRINITY_DN11298_c0_g1_i1.p1 TRINITY_DN11298_c0_g1~~TRINITY_DN11298_c0_g1_i1.p1  ORF type:complete len:432 (+),score=129.46 TRINITY_DN11298_c0_g1_i1:46-1341(+)
MQPSAWSRRDAALAAWQSDEPEDALPVDFESGLGTPRVVLQTVWQALRSHEDFAAAADRRVARTTLWELTALGLSGVAGPMVAKVASWLAGAGVDSVGAFYSQCSGAGTGVSDLGPMAPPLPLISAFQKVAAMSKPLAAAAAEPLAEALARYGLEGLPDTLRPDQQLLDHVRAKSTARRQALPFEEVASWPFVPPADLWRVSADEPERAVAHSPDGTAVHVVHVTPPAKPKLLKLAGEFYIAAATRGLCASAAAGKLGTAPAPLVLGHFVALHALLLSHDAGFVQLYDRELRKGLAGPLDLLTLDPEAGGGVMLVDRLRRLHAPTFLKVERTELRMLKAQASAPAPARVDRSTPPPTQAEKAALKAERQAKQAREREERERRKKLAAERREEAQAAQQEAKRRKNAEALAAGHGADKADKAGQPPKAPKAE